MKLLTLAFCTLLCCFLNAQAEPASEWESLTIPPGPTVPATTIKIRTCRTTLNTEEPLYIINGYPAEKKSLKELNPADIESISVFKDANAVALYGSSAVNGVVVINTKGKITPRADYTLTPEEIPADLFKLYENQCFGNGKQVVFLLNGKRKKLRKLQKIATTDISSVKVYQSGLKVTLMGYSEHEIVVDVLLR